MQTERGLERLITFLDAVVAIAITLLVLPLIDLLGEAGAVPLGELLGDHLAQLGSFALSFVVIARLWLVHHRMAEWVGGYDAVFLWLNLLWAFTIVLLPFSSQVVAAYGTEPLSLALYVGTITASAATTAAIAGLVRQRPALRRPGVSGADIGVSHGVITVVLLVLALVVGVVFRSVNFFALLLLFLEGPARWLLGALRSRKPAGARPLR